MAKLNFSIGKIVGVIIWLFFIMFAIGQFFSLTNAIDPETKEWVTSIQLTPEWNFTKIAFVSIEILVLFLGAWLVSSLVFNIGADGKIDRGEFFTLVIVAVIAYLLWSYVVGPWFGKDTFQELIGLFAKKMLVP